VGGGGQPYPPEGTHTIDFDLYKKRASALYSIDANKEERQSHKNPYITKLYEEFLDGKPGSHKAHELLHTSYQARKPRGIK
jgi:iron only hydrogenase large subunit-like protein